MDIILTPKQGVGMSIIMKYCRLIQNLMDCVNEKHRDAVKFTITIDDSGDGIRDCRHIFEYTGDKHVNAAMIRCVKCKTSMLVYQKGYYEKQGFVPAAIPGSGKNA